MVQKVVAGKEEFSAGLRHWNQKFAEIGARYGPLPIKQAVDSPGFMGKGRLFFL